MKNEESLENDAKEEIMVARIFAYLGEHLFDDEIMSVEDMKDRYAGYADNSANLVSIFSKHVARLNERFAKWASRT